MTAPTSTLAVKDPKARLVRLALRLVVVTMAYNIIEAGVALWSGLRAGSVALLGFGLDSVIETAAAAVLLWRLRVEAAGAPHAQVERAEKRVRRFVGATFLALAAYVVAESAWTLWRHAESADSPVGIALAAASLVIMPLVAVAKLRVAGRIGSSALRAEAKETLACSYLSFTLLLGLVLRVAAGLWQADPIAALLMTPWLIKEGLEGIRGEDCCGAEAAASDSCSCCGD